MDSFMIQLLDLVFFVFDKQDNVICFVPFAVMYFCFAMALVRRFVRRL